jgi:hypothetical protein
MLPLFRRVIKQRKVNRIRAGFDSGKGKVYYLAVWTTRGYDHGAVFGIRPLANGFNVTGRNLLTNEHFQGYNLEFVMETVKALEEPAHLLAHVK